MKVLFGIISVSAIIFAGANCADFEMQLLATLGGTVIAVVFGCLAFRS